MTLLLRFNTLSPLRFDITLLLCFNIASPPRFNIALLLRFNTSSPLRCDSVDTTLLLHYNTTLLLRFNILSPLCFDTASLLRFDIASLLRLATLICLQLLGSLIRLSQFYFVTITYFGLAPFASLFFMKVHFFFLIY
jgi:hypothetical protein